ncbi:hypothetical protein [Agromyces luteolus]|uniref:Uncharacterized protein n=1 Tax=Agromyces luteolus TaxID=88373 RepID=A0A7C9LD54_9MICO|nr:hypothetical protein [Agromyces luteolus]MUN05610.1 hypothetical protein [Agromyces luteolus]
MSAIAQIRSAATIEGDEARSRSAEIAVRFDGITTQAELRDAARESLRLYRGGMGSFQDVGSSTMAEAVARLVRSLRRAI